MSPLHRILIETLAKHLPPSGAALICADLTGTVAAELVTLRPDITPTPLTEQAATHDALTGIGALPGVATLHTWRAALRPGGRWIWIDPTPTPTADLPALGQQLTAAGYVRLLVESLPGGAGTLLRGEQPHTAAATSARIAVAAERDPAPADLSTYRGRFLFLLIRQTPYRPAWSLPPGTPIAWEAAAVVQNGTAIALAFSSLPQAVAFMQPAVTSGQIRDIHRIAKFPKTAASAWPFGVVINPPLSVLADGFHLLPVDAAAAITGEE